MFYSDLRVKEQIWVFLRVNGFVEAYLGFVMLICYKGVEGQSDMVQLHLRVKCGEL